MKLVLSLQGIDRLPNGEPPRLVLDRHGAIIGRSPHADWSLPDPRAHVSSRHCEIDYRDGEYRLIDTSTNGTFLNGADERFSSPQPLNTGDVIAIGEYRVSVEIGGAGALENTPPVQPSRGWEWNDDAPAAAFIATPHESAGAWGKDRPGPAERGWSNPSTSPDWSSARSSEVAPSSVSSSGNRTAGASDMAWAPARPMEPPEVRRQHGREPGDVWATLADSNTVDWARGGFAGSSGSPTWGAATPTLRVDEPQPQLASDNTEAVAILLKAAGLAPEDVQRPPGEILSTAGAALVRLVGGLVVMLEARTRAKAQLGAQGTMLELEGNNPLKFARSAERALAQLLGVHQRGYMAPDQAVEDAFKDLQAHQVATLAAMQGALRSTLDRFSPDAIRARAESHGRLARIIPSAREAELWRAYQREFEGVVKGSDEAFMDVFAKAFKEAYEKAARR